MTGRRADLVSTPTGTTMLTFRDDASGERTELSAAALGSWVARTAGLLRDGCGLRTGDRVAVLLPAHWQTAAVLLGAYSLGMAVSFRPWATAGLMGADEDAGAVFVSRQRLGSWLESVPEAPHRFVAAGPASADDLPEGYRDYVNEVGRFPDRRPEFESVRPSAPASPDGTTYGEWAGLAREVASRQGLTDRDRVLVDASADPLPLMWLLAPFIAGASIVICAKITSIDQIVADEGVTRVL